MNDRDQRIESHVRRRLTGRRPERARGVELRASWVRRLRAARRRKQRRGQTMMAAPAPGAAGAAIS